MEARKSLGDWQFLDFELSSNAQRMLVRTLRNGQVDVGIYDLKRNRFILIVVKFYIKNLKFWILKQLSDYKLVTFIFDVIFFCHLNGNKQLLKTFFVILY